MSRHVFPYGIKFREDSRIETFPAVELSILGRGGKGIRAILHIDSGATMSTLPLGDADVLGLDVRKSKKMLVRGITGDAVGGYRHTVAVVFEGTRVAVPVLFAELESFPRILGREGVFKKFGIIFDEMRQRTGFLDIRKERKALDEVLGG